MNFYAGRFSLLPINKNLFYQDGSEKKFSLLLEVFSERIEFKIRKDMNFIIEPILDHDGALIGGKIGRESVRKLPLSRELQKTPTKIYPYIIFIVLEEEQVFLFERNHSVFSEELVVFKYLRKYLNKVLFLKGLEVDIKPLTTKGRFWKLVEEMDRVYSVSFIFKAPNFLGDSYEALKDILNKEKADSNANQVAYSITNDAGELNVSDNSRYKSAVGWIEDGAGDWELKGRQKGKGKRKKTYRNTEQLTVFEVETDFDTLTTEVLKELKNKVSIGPHKVRGKNNDQ